jgi:CBS domain-containing protein
MLVSDILRNKGNAVVTIEPSVTVERLVALLAEHRIGAVVVSSDGVHVEGIVSERDVVQVLAAHGTAALSTPVGDLCSRDVVSVGTGDNVEQLMAVMTERRFRHLPVLEDGELRGIVSIGDVVKSRLDDLEVERVALTDYITTGR